MFDEDFGDEPGPQEVGYFSQGGGRAAATSLAPVPAPAPPAAPLNAAFSVTADSMDDMFDDPALATPVSSAATHNTRPPLAPTPTSAGGGSGGGRARPASQRRSHAPMLGSDDGSDSMDAMFDEDFGGPPTPGLMPQRQRGARCRRRDSTWICYSSQTRMRVVSCSAQCAV